MSTDQTIRQRHPDPVFDVDAGDFDQEVVARSRHVPVVVDFWASWCGPCRTLGPILEDAVTERDGQVLLAKVNVDENQQLAVTYGVRGIPAVKGFRNGEVVDEFVGAKGPREVEDFLARLVPSEADRLTTRAEQVADDDPDAARELLEQALEAEPDHQQAAVALARLVVDDDPQQALALVARHRPFPAAEEVAARAETLRAAGNVDELRARVATDPGDRDARLQLGRTLVAEEAYEEGAEQLLTVVREGGQQREQAREQLLAMFRMLGDDHPLVADTRKTLASVLY